MYSLLKIVIIVSIVLAQIVTTERVQVTGSGASVPFTLLWQIGYTEERNSFINYTSTDSGNGLESVILNGTDHFAGTAFIPEAYTQVPDFRAYPVLGVGINIAINIPGLTETLNVSRKTLLNIYTGKITQWNDAALKADNPGLADFLPAQTINVLAYTIGHNVVFINALWEFSLDIGSTDATVSLFPSVRPPSLLQWAYFDWASEGLNHTIVSDDTTKMPATISSTPYSIGYINLEESRPSPCSENMQIAAIINKAGNPTVGDEYHIQSALNTGFEKGLFSDPAAMYASILDLDGEYDFPISFPGYIAIDNTWQSSQGQDCTVALEFIYFVDWFTHRDTARALEVALSMVPVPSSLLPSLEAALSTFTCDGQSLYEPILDARQQKEISPDPSVKIAFSIIAGLFIVFFILLAIFVVIYKDKKIMKASTPLFLLIILLGAAGSMGYVISLMADPSTVSCSLWVAIKHVSFVFVYGGIFLKTWRVYRVFDVIWTHHHKPITDLRLGLYLLGFLLIMVVYLGIWFAVDLPTSEIVEDSILERYLQCKPSYFEIALFSIEVICLIFGAIVAHKVRHAPQAFNEAKWMGFSLYNWVLLGVMFQTLNMTIITDPTATYVLNCLTIIMTIGTAMLMLFAPKIYAIVTNVQHDSNTKSQMSRGKGTEGGDNGDCEENCRFKAENVRVRRELSRIQTAITKLDNPHRGDDDMNLMMATEKAIDEAININVPIMASGSGVSLVSPGLFQPQEKEHGATILKRRSVTQSISSFFRGSIYSNSSSSSNIFSMYSQPASSTQALNEEPKKREAV